MWRDDGSRKRPGGLTLIYDERPIHEYVFDAARVLMRFEECGVVTEPGQIEYHEIGARSRPHPPPIVEAENLGRQ